MTVPTHKTDYVSEGLSRLLEQYKDKPFLRAWITAYENRLQEIEDATWEVILLRELPVAEGKQLAKKGKLVGITQGSLTDDQFRREIAATLLILRSQGDPDTILLIAALIFPMGVLWDYSEEPIATIRIRVQSPLSSVDAAHVFRMVTRARAGGVRLFLDWSSFAANRTFTLRRFSEAPVDYKGLGIGHAIGDEGGYLRQELIA